MEYRHQVTGQLIGQLRVQKGMSQEVLSGLAGLARSHLAMIENGAKSPTVETLWQITAALGLPLSRFMQMVEERLLAMENK